MVTKGRLEAFSDGVFAIVITLLAFDLRPPSHEAGVSLASALWDLWPAYLAYIVGFLQIGVMWLNHHRVFQQVRDVDGCAAGAQPEPAAVGRGGAVPDGRRGRLPARRWPGRGDGHGAVTSAVLLLNAISFVSLYAWITHDERIIGTLPPRAMVRAARLRFGLGLGVYAGSFLSWFAPFAALAVHASMALYYAFDQATVSGDPPSTA